MEFFIEGGRSRSGKVLRPKMGMLSVVTRCVLENQVDDAMLVPISITYDKVARIRFVFFIFSLIYGFPTWQVVEGSAYTKELLGGAKEPESVVGVVKAARLLKFKFGRVDVNISRLH